MIVGLRFHHTDAPALRHLAARVRAADLKSDAGVFDSAAEAAATGEAMLLECDDLDEARRWVAGYVRRGIRPPAIEQPSGLILP